MRHIIKQNQPSALLKHQKQKGANYDNFKERKKLRASLLKEQGHLCALYVVN